MQMTADVSVGMYRLHPDGFNHQSTDQNRDLTMGIPLSDNNSITYFVTMKPNTVLHFKCDQLSSSFQPYKTAVGPAPQPLLPCTTCSKKQGKGSFNEKRKCSRNYGMK
jgi:hypothetical protein